MSYKQNAAANRDALFGPSSGNSLKPSKPKHKRDAQSNRDALFGGANTGSNKKSSSKMSSRSGSSDLSNSQLSGTSETASAGRGYSYSSKPDADSKKKKTMTSVLSGTAKVEKLKEAEDYREKAKKAMSRGFLSRPDPVAAGLLYKRAADAYQQCGENRLERLHRIASADLQMAQGTYATAAVEYTRAAELILDSEEPIDRKRKEGRKLHADAANAYLQMGERGKAAASKVESGLAMLWEDESSLMDKNALEALEEAVESHVPDPLNRYARYRQTGISAFIDPDAESIKPTPENMALAQEMLVRKAYAHEPLQKLVSVFCHYGEFASALYAAGAASTILEADGISTLTLSRSYIVETILLLAMGDPVAARQYFLEVHVQKDFYLTSRECKLSEELFTAVLARDREALDEARSPTGSNRAALSNLPEVLRVVVSQLRISGVARRNVKSTTAKPRTEIDEELDRELGLPPKPSGSPIKSESKTAPAEEEEEESESEDEEVTRQLKSDALQNELDALGLDTDDDDEEDDDSDIDLR